MEEKPIKIILNTQVYIKFSFLRVCASGSGCLDGDTEETSI
jgi:hypothetical protein